MCSVLMFPTSHAQFAQLFSYHHLIFRSHFGSSSIAHFASIEPTPEQARSRASSWSPQVWDAFEMPNPGRERSISLDTREMCKEHPDMIDLNAFVSLDQQSELVAALGDLGWTSTRLADLRSSQLSTGLSNKNYRVTSADDGPLFLRVCGYVFIIPS